MIVGVDGRELQGSPTGTGRYLASLLRHWGRKPEARIVVYLSGGATTMVRPSLPTVTWRELGSRPMRGIVWQERVLPRAVRADAIDVFFSPAYTCPLSLRLPRVLAVHDLSFFFWPADFRPFDAARRRLLTAVSMRASRGIVACSAFTRGEIIRRFPGLEDRVHLVPLGPDDDLPPAPSRSAARRQLGIAGPYVIAVGSIFNRRRVRELLLAVGRLARRWPDLRLDIIGENRTHPRLDLQATIHETGADGHAFGAGFVAEADLVTRYAAADLLVALSEYEGFGLPALEAMARGLPVVAADRPALSEVVAGAGLRVDPADPRAIERAIECLLASPAMSSDYRRRGLTRAGELSWDRAAQRTWQIIEGATRS